MDDIDELTYESDELDAARLFTPSSGKLQYDSNMMLHILEGYVTVCALSNVIIITGDLRKRS